MGHEMDLQLGKVGLSGSARRHCFPSPAINPVAELQPAASTNRRSHRHHIPESLPESQKLPNRFAEDPSIDCATELSSSINKTRMRLRLLAASGEATAAAAFCYFRMKYMKTLGGDG